MLSVDYDRLGLQAGERLLDLGCGAGRHAFEGLRRGAHVVALDRDGDELERACSVSAAMAEAGELPDGARFEAVQGDARSLPFEDASFDRVIASEVLEHVEEDRLAMSELFRVLRPGGALAVTVPRFGPELVNWALSDRYHSVPGGHVRIYRRSQLVERLSSAGFEVEGFGYAHGLHSPYWWLKCLVGIGNDASPLVAAYHRVLVADIVSAPRWTRILDGLLTPLIGKSMVVYTRRPHGDAYSGSPARSIVEERVA
jgi:SAM-dependent methyltransferase